MAQGFEAAAAILGAATVALWLLHAWASRPAAPPAHPPEVYAPPTALVADEAGTEVPPSGSLTVALEMREGNPGFATAVALVNGSAVAVDTGSGLLLANGFQLPVAQGAPTQDLAYGSSTARARVGAVSLFPLGAAVKAAQVVRVLSGRAEALLGVASAGLGGETSVPSDVLVIVDLQRGALSFQRGQPDLMAPGAIGPGWVQLETTGRSFEVASAMTTVAGKSMRGPVFLDTGTDFGLISPLAPASLGWLQAGSVAFVLGASAAVKSTAPALAVQGAAENKALSSDTVIGLPLLIQLFSKIASRGDQLWVLPL